MNWDSEVKQSQRINKYKEVLDLLISKQLVYPCFEDPEELTLKEKLNCHLENLQFMIENH